MGKIFVLAMAVMIVLIGTLSIVVKVQRVKAVGSIYIRADGSVDPPTASITSADNVTYTFTGDINNSVVVERGNIIIDGNGCALHGNGYGDGVSVCDISNVTIRNTNIRGFDSGVYFNSTSCNVLSGNNITNNLYGVDLGWSFSNNLSGNHITDNEWWGVWLNFSSGNILSENNVANNYIGIWLCSSSSNILSRTNVSNSYRGIWLFSSFSNTLLENNIASNNGSVWLDGGFNNTLCGNNVADSYRGVWLLSSSNNTFYHNNFVGNTIQVDNGDLANMWDYGHAFGGNYWSNYAGADSDIDGIGDEPYVINENNQDNYPLMGTFSSFNTPYGYEVDFVSNSSISDFDFRLVDSSQATLTFNVTEEIGTQGFCRICIPKALINGSYVVRFNGEMIVYPQVRELPCSNETYEYLYINYTHSEHKIEISGTTTIPEFGSFVILPLFMIATLLLLVVTVYGRKRYECRR